MRLLLLLALLLPATAQAQLVASDTLSPPPNTDTIDIRAFRVIYEIENPVFVTAMQQSNIASKKIFFGVAPALAVGTLVTGSDFDPVVRLGASQALATGLTYALKGTVRRPRPYRTLEGIEYRAQEHNPDFDPFSFPSGHSAMAFSIATSVSLSYPKWYVIAPAYGWASATALARVWHGVHYPSDILVGAVIGAGSATLVHLFLPGIDPDSEPGDVVVGVSLGL